MWKTLKEYNNNYNNNNNQLMCLIECRFIEAFGLNEIQLNVIRNANKKLAERQRRVKCLKRTSHVKREARSSMATHTQPTNYPPTTENRMLPHLLWSRFNNGFSYTQVKMRAESTVTFFFQKKIRLKSNTSYRYFEVMWHEISIHFTTYIYIYIYN